MPLMTLSIILTFTLVNSTNHEINSTNAEATNHEQMSESTKIKYSNESVASEMQHTICSVKTEDIVAEARSTVSRILTGVCTSDELTKGFKDMEKIIEDKFEKIQKTLVELIETKFQPTAQKKSLRNSKSSPFKTIDYLFDQHFFKNHT